MRNQKLCRWDCTRQGISHGEHREHGGRRVDAQGGHGEHGGYFAKRVQKTRGERQEWRSGWTGRGDGESVSGFFIPLPKITEMIIAEQKRKENIAEYLIYMYQVEDLIRANGLDPVKIDQTIISQFNTDYDVKREMLEWYKGLIDRLKSENKEKKGHMDFLNRIVDELNKLNIQLLHEPLNNDFKDSYDRAKGHIDALRMRAGHSGENDVQLALNGLYGLLILKLQKKEISGETKSAFRSISEWIAMLSSEFMKNEEGI